MGQMWAVVLNPPPPPPRYPFKQAAKIKDILQKELLINQHITSGRSSSSQWQAYPTNALQAVSITGNQDQNTKYHFNNILPNENGWQCSTHYTNLHWQCTV